MARGVLIAAALALSAAAAAAEPARITCRGGGGDDALALVQGAVTSPLYAWLARRYGTAESCRIEARDGTLGATLGFPGKAELRIEATPAIEASSYTATLAPPPPGAAEVAATLRAFSLWAAEPGGCGLSHSALLAAARSAEPEATVDGNTCSCRATLMHGAAGLTGFRFSMAC